MSKNKKRKSTQVSAGVVENEMKKIFSLKKGERFLSPVEDSKVCIMESPVDVKKYRDGSVAMIKLRNSSGEIVFVPVDTSVSVVN